jgi:hypothetical protein
LKDLYRSHFGIYYGSSIAFAIRSFDPSLSTQLIVRLILATGLVLHRLPLTQPLYVCTKSS